jgi:hypothetical protein
VTINGRKSPIRVTDILTVALAIFVLGFVEHPTWPSHWDAWSTPKYLGLGLATIAAEGAGEWIIALLRRPHARRARSQWTE